MSAGVVLVCNTLSWSANQGIFGRAFFPTGRGFCCFAGSTPSLLFQIRDPGEVNSGPAYTVLSTDIGKVLCLLMTYDNSNVRLYVNGVAQTPVPETGYSAPTGSDPTWIGHPSAGGINPAADFTILGACAGTGVASAADAAVWTAEVRAQRQVVDIPGCTDTHRWDRNPGAPTPWTDEVSAAVLTKAGALTDHYGPWIFP